MERETWYGAEELMQDELRAINVPCPHCHTNVGQLCTGTRSTHLARIESADWEPTQR